MTNGSGRTRSYATVVYPESAPENWIDFLNENKVPCLVSPLHDSDINLTGEHKKPHFHVLLLFDSVKSQEQASDVIKTFGGVGCERVNSVRGYARYLCHLDNPEKAQYDICDVRQFFGADYSALIQNVSDKYAVISDMMDFIYSNRIHYFNNFMDYCRQNNETWFRALCDNCGWIIKEYIKSLTYEDMSEI